MEGVGWVWWDLECSQREPASFDEKWMDLDDAVPTPRTRDIPQNGETGEFWRDLDGFGGMWMGLEGFGWIWWDLECIRLKLASVGEIWMDMAESGMLTKAGIC